VVGVRETVRGEAEVRRVEWEGFKPEAELPKAAGGEPVAERSSHKLVEAPAEGVGGRERCILRHG
jgi:hypothetical protein